MKLMIDIPDKIYETVQNGTYCGTLYEELKNGTPLSESGDCVSRQAVLDLAKFDGRENLGSIIHAFDVEQLPPVTPAEKVGKWIPVSERLPEESLNSVIGWDAYRERCIFVQFIDGHFQITGKNETFDIQAWMPLPEPYKASPTGAERNDKE